jgi:hypothetical protein
MADGEGLIRPAVVTGDLLRGARNSDHRVGRALDVLMQDVRQVRGDVMISGRQVNNLRGKLTEAHQEMRQALTAIRQIWGKN